MKDSFPRKIVLGLFRSPFTRQFNIRICIRSQHTTLGKLLTKYILPTVVLLCLSSINLMLLPESWTMYYWSFLEFIFWFHFHRSSRSIGAFERAAACSPPTILSWVFLFALDLVSVVDAVIGRTDYKRRVLEEEEEEEDANSSQRKRKPQQASLRLSSGHSFLLLLMLW